MEFNRAQLKRGVKLAMKGTRPSPVLATLAFTVLVSVVTGLMNAILGGMLTGNAHSLSDTLLFYIQMGYEFEYAMERAVLEFLGQGPGAIFGVAVGGSVLSILVTLWQSTMNVGYEGYCLSMSRRENPPLGRIFCAFPQFAGVLLTRFLTGLFIVLWSLLVAAVWFAAAMGLVMVAAALGSDLLAVLFVMVSIFALWAAAIWVTARYALVDYVLLDKNLTGLDAIRESKRLMKGNIGRYFVLQLSFFGWYLLMIGIIYAVIFAFVGMMVYQMYAGAVNPIAVGAMMIVLLGIIPVYILSLWLKPYVTGSAAAFYDWVRAGGDGAPAGPGFGGGADGWGGPGGYTWTSGGSSGPGTGMGSGSAPGGGSQNGGGLPPRPPKPPRDDPWN